MTWFSRRWEQSPDIGILKPDYSHPAYYLGGESPTNMIWLAGDPLTFNSSQRRIVSTGEESPWYASGDALQRGGYRGGSSGRSWQSVANAGVNFGGTTNFPLFNYNQGYTAVVVSAPYASTIVNTAFSSRFGASTFSQWDVWANADGAGATTSGAFGSYFRANTSPANTGIHATSQLDGLYHCWVVGNSASTGFIYRDGIKQSITRTAHPATADLSSSSETRIGNLGNYTSTGYAHINPLALVFIAAVCCDEGLAQTLSENPWQLVEAPKNKLWFFLSTTSGVSGTSNTTNVNDTSSASGTTTVTGSLTYTNDNDTIVASGTTTVTGSSSTTNTDDSVNASGTVGSGAVSGTVSYTNENDTVVISGTTTVVGSVTYTNANDTCSASGTAAVGDLSLILKILANKQTLDADTGLYTLYDDDGTTILYQVAAWEDVAGTIPYRGRTLSRIDRLE